MKNIKDYYGMNGYYTMTEMLNMLNVDKYWLKKIKETEIRREKRDCYTFFNKEDVDNYLKLNKHKELKKIKIKEPKYCSNDCRKIASKKIKLCKHCNKEFYGKGNTQFCSQECKKENNLTKHNVEFIFKREVTFSCSKNKNIILPKKF